MGFRKTKRSMKTRVYFYIPKFKDLENDYNDNSKTLSLEYYATRVPGRMQLFDEFNDRKGKMVAFDNVGHMMHEMLQEYQKRMYNVTRLFKSLKKDGINFDADDFNDMIAIKSCIEMFFEKHNNRDVHRIHQILKTKTTNESKERLITLHFSTRFPKLEKEFSDNPSRELAQFIIREYTIGDEQ